MKTEYLLHTATVALTLAFSLQPSALVCAAPLGTAFTYQGRLTAGGQPASGSYDLMFTLHGDASVSNVVAAPIISSAVGVTNGLFTVTLDFGASVFTGDARWLEILVCTNGGAFTMLAPRQPLTPTPYAIMANTASNLLGTLPAAQLSGTVANGQLANNSLTVNAGTGLSGGGPVSLGGSTTLANAGVLSVTGNADITASPTAGNVTLGTTATSANTASTLVKRDGSGNFSAQTITLAGSLALPSTSGSSAGVLSIGGTPFLHTFGTYNMFVGSGAGNFTMSGFNNTAVGGHALYSNTSGSQNTALGDGALFANITAGQNTAVGYAALNFNTNGAGNTAVGHTALVFNRSGSDNTAVGTKALGANTSGYNNTAYGFYALYANTSGANNIALGYQAGGNIATGSYNIDIGNEGFSTDNNIIRIGTPGVQNNTFIAGVINGDGSGLINVTAATLAIPPGMALIPAGVFTMGNSIGDGDSTDANPTNVYVSAFYMEVNLVSWSQWQSVYFWATNHAYGFTYAGLGKAANHPVQTVDWYDCVKWCNARSQQAGKPPVYYTDAGLTQVYTNGEVAVYPNWAANGYRLPTEAEWEKAARGGLSGQRFPWGNVISQNLANYYGNTSYSYDLGPNGYNAAFTNGVSPYTSPVGYFAPNGYGLNDMAGNVFEWCWDWYGTPYTGESNPHGPAGPLSYRVLRGGSWLLNACYPRCAYRYAYFPAYAYFYSGFRCVRGL